MPEAKTGTSSKKAQEAPVEEPVVTEPIEPEEPVVETPAVPEPPTEIKVKYVGGQGIELAYPLSSGQRSFIGGVVYTLKNYGDFCRLTEASPHFVEVKDEPAR